MKIVIVDDEITARNTMKLLLNRLTIESEIIAEIESVAHARKELSNLNFDVLLLDIELLDGNGFEILKFVPKSNPNVIFTTAFHQYAIKAFKENAVDYLLKPIDLDELKDALNKCLNSPNHGFNYNNLLQKLKSDLYGIKIAVNGSSGIDFVNSKDIYLLESDGSYTNFHDNNETKITSSKSLKHFEDLLPKSNFFRINRNQIINMDLVAKFRKDVQFGMIILKNGCELYVSRRRKVAFKKAVSEFLKVDQ